MQNPDRRREASDGYDASEIEEDEGSSDEGKGSSVCRMATIREEVGTVFSYDFDGGEDAVYVAVGEEENCSMDALIWTVDNAVVNRSSTVVFLVHVFPETKFVPSPLGMLPINQVNPQQKEMYVAQQHAKRREFLQKFLNFCSTSKVKVDTILLESNTEAKAILDLIPILHIQKLVLGVTKSTLRKMKSRKGNTVANQIVQNAPEFCDVKIISEGKEMRELAWHLSSPSPSSSTSPRASDRSLRSLSEEEQTALDQSAMCGCFKLQSNSYTWH